MGTRSITIVKDTNKNTIIEMYRQYDGYPEGMGQDLIDFVTSGKLVNGIQMGEEQRVFNGMECFAAQLVAHFKQGAGGFYLHAPTKNTNKIKPDMYAEMYGAEYVYVIDSNLNIKCYDTYSNDLIFDTETDGYEIRYEE